MSDKEPLVIVGVERVDGDEVLVAYSDGSTAVYGIEQLKELKPKKLVTEKVNWKKDAMQVPNGTGKKFK
jgi:hypothetical protein